ncbi:MAG: aldo/keto reductase [Acidobacteriota bacterium]|nr:MAG: aldo/keto reductase [Acidobacteriota bacterium]
MYNHATAEGTRRYAERFGHLAPDHFRMAQDLTVSSIGIGTYLGAFDDATDEGYRGAIARALELGCNFIDTAVNYRCQRSERAIGEALKKAFTEGSVRRDEVVVSTKGGYFPYEREVPSDVWAYFHERFEKPGILHRSEVVGDIHAMTPRYLENLLETSLRNLGLDCIDVYYIHNPEHQLPEVGREEFYKRLRAAFEFLESKVREGKIHAYGTATWNGYRVSSDSPDHLDLARVVQSAEGAGGKEHHFRFLMFPLNMAMLEAVASPTQHGSGRDGPVLQVAADFGLTAVSSSTILQGRLAHGLPESVQKAIGSLSTDAQRAIQFNRSLPGLAAAFVGMSRVGHVEENLKVAETQPLSGEQLVGLLGGSA